MKNTPRFSGLASALPRPTLVLLTGALLSSACTSLEQARACKSLSEAINPLADEIRAQAPGGQAVSPSFVREQAARYFAIGQRLTPLSSPGAPLHKTVQLLAQEVLGISEVLNEAALAQEAGQPHQYRAARGRLDAAATRLRDMQNQIDRRCRD